MSLFHVHHVSTISVCFCIVDGTRSIILDEHIKNFYSEDDISLSLWDIGQFFVPSHWIEVKFC